MASRGASPERLSPAGPAAPRFLVTSGSPVDLLLVLSGVGQHSGPNEVPPER